LTYEEGQKVWVVQSNSGYQGLGKILGPVPVNKWLVQALDGSLKVFTVATGCLKEVASNELPSDLSKEERRELRKKMKAERKNHRASEGSMPRRSGCGKR
jgi:uncharacterized membrane protein